MSAMRQEWAKFINRHPCNPNDQNYALIRAAFYAGWTNAIKRLRLVESPEDNEKAVP